MNENEVIALLKKNAENYNDGKYFEEDPIKFPKHFAKLYENGEASLQDVEIAAVIAAHLAWGRRDMIVRDCKRAFDEMQWKPFEYVQQGLYRADDTSLHRTVKWNEFAAICGRLKIFYETEQSLEVLSPDQMRVLIFGQKSDKGAANKKIHMMRRWMVRNDKIVDLGLWKSIDKRELIIPLDIHVHRTALELGITTRQCTDFKTAKEITDFLLKAFPEDPVLGDFALFAVAASKKNKKTLNVFLHS